MVTSHRFRLRWRRADESSGRPPRSPVIGGTRHSLGRLVRHFAIRGLWGLALFLIIEYLVLPIIPGAKTLHRLATANYWLIPVAMLAEFLSLFAYAKLTTTVLPRPQPSLGTVAKVDLSSLAVSHVLPGGTASGAGLSVRLFNSLGVRPADSGFAIATQGLGSAVILNLMLWTALIVSIPLYGFQLLYLLVALLGILLISGFAVLVISFSRGAPRITNCTVWVIRHLPYLRRFEDKIISAISRIAEQVNTLAGNRPLVKKAAVWALLNWVLDATALWIMLAAFGSLTNPDALLVAYGIANVLAVIPITPSGLGVVEATLIALLSGFGTPRGVAILGVLAYRLINFWLPIPVGVGTYVALRVSRGEDATLELDTPDPPNRD